MKKMGFGLMRLPQTDKDKPETINQEQVKKKDTPILIQHILIIMEKVK